MAADTVRRVQEVRSQLLTVLALLDTTQTPQRAQEALADAYDALGTALVTFESTRLEDVRREQYR